MTAVTTSPRMFDSLPFSRLGFVCLICAATVVSGCGGRKRPAIAWTSAVMLRPIAPTVGVQPVTDVLDDAPDFRVELVPPPRLSTPRLIPARPHVAASVTGANNNAHGDELVLAPELSPEETEAAQHETNQSIGAAEKNLASSQSRKLNPAQADLASKIKGFLTDAKEAARAGDWDRARSLARKAQILSQDLIGSL